jgi:hypothetical protein
MNKSTVILVILATCLCFSAFATPESDMKSTDETTYRLYIEKKWDSVIVVGKRALKENIDFYYLRVRMGLSYFFRQEYIPAATHLARAREFDAGDPVIADYLYWAYIYTNRLEAARLLKATLAVAPGTGYSPENPVEWVRAESGITLSSNDKILSKPFLMGADSIYGETDLYGNYLYESLSARFSLSKRIGLTVGYNYLNFSKTKYIQYARIEDHLDQVADSSWGKYYHYSFPRVTYDTAFQYRINQHELHAGLSWYLDGGFRIQPAFHALYVAWPKVSAHYNIVTVQDTGYYLADSNKYVTFPFDRVNYSYEQKDTSFFNFVGALTVSKELGRFTVGLSGSWSNINNMTQKQIGGFATWLPFGNLNLYGTTSVTGFFQKGGNRLLLSQVIGGKITRWCWGEAVFHYGDFTNANILNGSVVYNNSDVIDWRAGATLYFLVSRHVQLSLSYQYVRKESETYYYKFNESKNQVSSKPSVELVPYSFNSLIGGISVKF